VGFRSPGKQAAAVSAAFLLRSSQGFHLTHSTHKVVVNHDCLFPVAVYLDRLAHDNPLHELPQQAWCQLLDVRILAHEGEEFVCADSFFLLLGKLGFKDISLLREGFLVGLVVGQELGKTLVGYFCVTLSS